MQSFKHSPHPVDLSDFLFGHCVVTGGRDFEEEEKKYSGQEDQSPSATILGSVNRLRHSVSEKLFSIKLEEITF